MLVLPGRQVCERTCHSAGARCSMSYCREAQGHLAGSKMGETIFQATPNKNTKEANLLFTIIYICILYLWTCKMGILCLEPLGLKNCLVGYGIKFLMMVMAMVLFGKMAHVSTKAFFLGNPAYNFWCLNVFDISPLNQLTLSSHFRHMHTHMFIVILFFCTEV